MHESLSLHLLWLIAPSKFHVLHNNVRGNLTDEVVEIIDLDAVGGEQFFNFFGSLRLIFVANGFVLVEELTRLASLYSALLLHLYDELFHR